MKIIQNSLEKYYALEAQEQDTQSGLNLKAGTNIGITAVEDALNNRVDYVITAINSGIENNTTSNINGTYLLYLP